MKSIFDKETRSEVVDRISLLKADSKPQWGEMTAAQMARHCALCDEYYFGNIKVKRAFLGRILGKVAINSILKDETTNMRRNSSTPPQFKVTENITDLETEKDRWKELINRYSIYKDGGFEHWFFGKLSNEQLGQLIYKHADHHLRQFSC